MSQFWLGFITCVGAEAVIAIVYLLRHRIAKALGREASGVGAKLQGK